MVDILVLIVLATGAVVAAAALFAFSFTLFQRPETGIIALIGIFVLTAWLGPKGILLGGIFVAPYDLLCVLFAIIAVIRWTQQRPVPAQIAWALAGMLIFLSTLRGLNYFDVGTVGNELRHTEIFYFWSCASYFSSFSRHPDMQERSIRILVWGAVAIAILVFLRWGLEMSGHQITRRLGEVGSSPFRVIPANEAMFLVSVMIVMLQHALSNETSKWFWTFLVVLTFQVVLLQHRSVWLAAAAGVLVLAMLDWRGIKKLTPYLPLLIVPAVLGLAALIAQGALDGIMTSLTYSTQNVATLSWRQEGWSDLLAQWVNAGGFEKLFGQPFGTGFRRHLHSLGTDVAYSPHNSYLTFLFRLGAFGLAAIIVTYVLCFKNMFKIRRGDGMSANLNYVIAALAAQLVYFMFYGPNIAQAIFVGIGLSHTIMQDSTRRLRASMSVSA